MDKAQDVLSKEELEFLLSPVTDEESAGLSTHPEAEEGEDREDANDGEAGCEEDARERDRDNGPSCKGDRKETGPAKGMDAAGSDPVLLARTDFFAGLLEEELRRVIRAHVRARPHTPAEEYTEDVVDELESPAFFALLDAGAEDLLFACDPLTTQGLADASLGAGHLSSQVRGTLSFFDKELVGRCLEGLPRLIARAFALPSCATSRIVWYADDIFLTARDEKLCVLRLSLEIDGLGGECLLALPKGLARPAS